MSSDLEEGDPGRENKTVRTVSFFDEVFSVSYLFLCCAIGFELLASTLLRYSRGFEDLVSGSASLVFFMLSLLSLGQAIKTIPLALAYSLWCGVGIVGTLLLSFYLFEDTVGGQQVAGSLIIIVGAVMVYSSAG